MTSSLVSESSVGDMGARDSESVGRCELASLAAMVMELVSLVLALVRHVHANGATGHGTPESGEPPQHTSPNMHSYTHPG